jgi:hypothetical protein
MKAISDAYNNDRPGCYIGPSSFASRKMIIEKLDTIALRLSSMLKKAEVIGTLDNLVGALNNYIGGPNEENLKQVSAHLATLEKRLGTDEWKFLPRTWLLYLDEIGFTQYLGENLVAHLKGILKFADMTSVQTRDEINRIKGEIEKFIGAFDQIVAASKTLKIQKDQLAPGEAELGVLLPRGLFDNELQKFSQQALILDSIVRVFEELATGSRESPKIHLLSSSDPTIFLYLTPPAVLLFLKALNMLLSAYEKVLNIRKLRAEIARQLSPELTRKIEEEAQEKVRDAIKDIVPAIMKDAPVADDARKNELSNELSIRLPTIASWIDRGVRIEATIQPLPAKKDGEDEAADVSRLRSLSQEIAQLSQQIRRYELVGEPILNLPRNDDVRSVQ